MNKEKRILQKIFKTLQHEVEGKKRKIYYRFLTKIVRKIRKMSNNFEKALLQIRNQESQGIYQSHINDNPFFQVRNQKFKSEVRSSSQKT